MKTICCTLAIALLAGATAALSQTPLSIYDIQHASSWPYASPWADSTVMTSGIVTAVAPSGYFIQDGDSVWCGIYVFDNTNAAARGDSVRLTAQVSEYFRLTELKSVSSFNITSSGNALPAPVSLPTDTSGYEPYEGMLVQVSNAVCNDPNSGFGQWIVNDGSGNVFVDDLIYAYTPTMNATYDVTGALYYSFSEWKIEPRDSADIAELIGMPEESAAAVLKIFPNPAGDFVSIRLECPTADGVVLTLEDLSGKVILSRRLSAGSGQIVLNTGRFASGLYVLGVTGEGISLHRKLWVK